MFNLEKEHERLVVKTLENEGAWVVKFSDPKRRGGPDRLVLGDRFNPFYFIEFKRPRGIKAQLQKRYAWELWLRGIDVYLIKSEAEAAEFLALRKTSLVGTLASFLLK